jgi:hypothetical protein
MNFALLDVDLDLVVANFQYTVGSHKKLRIWPWIKIKTALHLQN